MSLPTLHIEVELRGTVQGVGFRPAVHRLAARLGLGGSVTNNGGVVRLVLEGRVDLAERFLSLLPASLPAQARLESMVELLREECPSPASQFVIGESAADATVEISFPPDLRTCEECFGEVLDPSDRRHRYAFTTCTQCGPRFTVINDLPYDRERTTLNSFALCGQCLSEYRDPAGRRFHAESIACPKCGPQLALRRSSGEPLSGDPLLVVHHALRRGDIAAVRGIGGYLLVVDALNAAAVRRLRERKKRPAKPFAVCASSLQSVRRFCRLSAEEERGLLSPEGPIVVLELREEFRENSVFKLLSPDTATLGVMLPTSPLHLLLFGGVEDPFELLVMTSGNRRSEPICISNEEAELRLEGIADLYLEHNREINLRADDSVGAEVSGELRIWRKARGFAPRGLNLRKPLCRSAVGLGAELKNTISVGDQSKILSSPHIGDLDTPEAAAFFEQMVETYLAFYRIDPAVVAVDLHPDLRSTVFGKSFAKRLGVRLLEVQHHHAHTASVMAEYGINTALGLVFDGTGFGTDQTIWGSELLYCEGDRFERLAHFEAAPLPGADKAVWEPRRQLAARAAIGGFSLPETIVQQYAISEDEARTWALQSERGLNAPRSSGAGRLFDSFSAALGLAPLLASYDGQAAVRLEAVARTAKNGLVQLPAHAAEVSDTLVVKWSAVFSALLDLRGKKPTEELAYACHAAIARAAVEMVEYGLARYPGIPVLLSGGCFMNKLFTESLIGRLVSRSIPVYLPRLVPPNDGGISVGQVYLAGMVA